jgi:hypothetical protein
VCEAVEAELAALGYLLSGTGPRPVDAD